MEQFASTVVVLLVAAVVAAALGDLKDTVALNGLLGFVQEYRAEQAMAALKAMTAPMVRIRRGGRVMVVPAAAIVPGDLVRLGPGDLLAADLRLTESWALRVNDAALTGESEPVTKQVEPLPRSSPGGLWQHALWVGLTMAAVCLALLVGARAAGWPWQTMAFTTLALLQLGHALVVRSERESFFTLGARSNPFLLAAVLGAVAVQLAVLRRLRRGGAREVDHPPAVPKVPPDTGLMALLHGPPVRAGWSPGRVRSARHREVMTVTATVEDLTPLERQLGTVDEAMTRNAVLLAADMTAEMALRRLDQKAVSGAPVVDHGRVVGVITRRDLLVPTLLDEPSGTQAPGRLTRLAGLRVSDLMSSEPVTAPPDCSLVQAVRTMIRHGVNRLPVVDQAGRPIGVLTRDDVLGAVARGVQP